MRALAALALLALATALAALASAYPGYVDVRCVFNGTHYAGGDLAQWQRPVADNEGLGYTYKETFTTSFDHTFALNSTLYHLFERYHDILYIYQPKSGSSGWRVEGYVEVNHTYAASLTPSGVYTFPLWHPQYTGSKSDDQSARGRT